MLHHIYILYAALLSYISSLSIANNIKADLNSTNYFKLCTTKNSECLKTSLYLTNKYRYTIHPNSTYPEETLQEHFLISDVFYTIGSIYYYGSIDNIPNLPLGLSNFIISSYFGNPSAQFKLYILLETNLFSQITSMPAFKQLLDSDSYLQAIQQTLFYNNFIANTTEALSTRAMQFLFSSALGKNIAAMMTLGFKFLTGYGLASSCEISTKYYQEAAYQSIKHKSMINTITYYNFVSLVKYEYLEFKYKIQSDNIIEQIDFFKLNAQKGDITAIQQLGKIFLFGYEGMQDFNEAFKWYSLGAELNDTQSIYYLGEMYLKGIRGEEPNYAKAFDLFTQASKAGYSLAWNSLGMMYYYGYGVDKNPKRAYDYFNKAINTNLSQPVDDAMFNLMTLLIEDKNDIIPDFSKAYKYANLISINKHTYGMYFLAMMNHYSIGSSINSCDLNIEYFKQTVERDIDSKRIYDSAFHYYKTGHYRIAALMFIELAEQGYEYAQINAALILKNYDIFIDKHFQRQLTFKYAKLASKLHNVYSFMMLGDFYSDGYGDVVKKDYQQAMHYYKKIAMKAFVSNFLSAHSHFNIGLMHNLGRGVEKNMTMAKMYYDIAIKSESSMKYPVMLIDIYNHYSGKNLPQIIKEKAKKVIDGFIHSKVSIGIISSFIIFYSFAYYSIKNQKA